jgi:hypothetical protein
VLKSTTPPLHTRWWEDQRKIVEEHPHGAAASRRIRLLQGVDTMTMNTEENIAAAGNT